MSVADGTGAEGNSFSTGAAISGDGRYVAFGSFASNLVAGDTNNTADIFVRDTLNGTTRRVSVDSNGVQADNESSQPAITADGRYVAFASLASNLDVGVPEVGTDLDIFVHDNVAGTTIRASVDTSGGDPSGPGGHGSFRPAISDNGRYVTFWSEASDLVAGDTNGTLDVFVRDTVAGTTSRVSVSDSAAQGDSDSFKPVISADGRYVAFESDATNLVAADTNARRDVFVRDTMAGTTSRVSISDSEAEGNDGSFRATISADGRYVVFDSVATNLVTGDTNTEDDEFVRDTVAGTTSRVSVDSAGTQGNDASFRAAISADGRYVVFDSAATNLVAGDTNSAQDVFVRDTLSATTTRVSVNRIGAQANGSTFVFGISADGRYVALNSDASNLVSDDSNDAADIFVRANPEPVVTGIVPSTLTRGTTTAVTVTGTYFLSGAKLVIDGGGVTVANVTVVNENQITADVTVAADAASNSRNVYVELPGTGPGPSALTAGVCGNCLTVN